MSSLFNLIKAPISSVFRRAYIKRRDIVDGLFEDDWLEISEDVKSYGKITKAIDSARRSKFTFGNAKLVMENEDGRYNPSSDLASLWYGYLNQQRTLVKIEAGLFKPSLGADGIWDRNEQPYATYFDQALWDEATSLYDSESPAAVFTGIISGDIVLSDKNEVVLNIKPLSSIFQDYPARNLVGWTSTGMTASQFVTMVRDQTDGSSNFIFKPFFGNTNTYFDISTTSNVFSNLNTSTAEGVIDKTVWEVIEKLSEAENFVPYITNDGVFKFVSRDSVATTSVYEFHGGGSYSPTYGQTIKNVSSYGFKISKYYSRVSVKWNSDDTATSYTVVESPLTVSSSSNPWVLGVRTLSLENFYIPNTATASTLAQTIFDDVSGLKNEIELQTTFIPHLDLFDRVAIYYDPSQVQQFNLWDQNNWAADDTNTASDLIFDNAVGDAIILEGQEFKFLSLEIDLDNFQNKFVAREV